MTIYKQMRIKIDIDEENSNLCGIGCYEIKRNGIWTLWCGLFRKRLYYDADEMTNAAINA